MPYQLSIYPSIHESINPSSSVFSVNLSINLFHSINTNISFKNKESMLTKQVNKQSLLKWKQIHCKKYPICLFMDGKCTLMFGKIKQLLTGGPNQTTIVRVSNHVIRFDDVLKTWCQMVFQKKHKCLTSFMFCGKHNFLKTKLLCLLLGQLL